MSKKEARFLPLLGDVDDGEMLESSTSGFLVRDDEHVLEDLRVGLEVNSLESEGGVVARPDDDVRVLVFEVRVKVVLSKTIGWRFFVVGRGRRARSRRHRSRRKKRDRGREGRRVDGRCELERKEAFLSFRQRTVTTTSRKTFTVWCSLYRTMFSACSLPVECLQFVQAPMVRPSLSPFELTTFFSFLPCFADLRSVPLVFRLGFRISHSDYSLLDGVLL